MSQWTILSKQNLCILAAFVTITYIYTITTQSNKWCTYLSFTPSSRRGELNLTADERRQRNIFLAERETVYKDRNALVKNICKKYKSDETLFKRNLNAVARNLFKVDGDNKLAMCGNAKVNIFRIIFLCVSAQI